MSRYGKPIKDDLYDELQYRFEESHVSLKEFIVMLMQVIADLIENEGSRL